MIRNIALGFFALLFFTFFYLNNQNEWFMMNETVGMMHLVALAIIGFSLSLTLIFHRSRLFFVLLLLTGFSLLAELFEYLRHTQESLSYRGSVGVLFDLYILTFIPALIMLMSALKDRGVVTTIGWLRFLAVLLLWVLFVYILMAEVHLLEWVKAQSFLPFSFFGWHDIEMAILLISLIFFIIRAVVRPLRTEYIYLVTYIGVILAVTLPKTLDHFIIMTTFIALIVLIDIISRSYYMAYIDELTELKGRRAMNEALVRLGGQYTLVMGDIDHFKNFNDTYGHDIGDEVLKLVATELMKVKGGGEAYRWGGEEFVLLFANKNAEQVLEYVEKVRIGIEKHPFCLRDKHRPDVKPKAIKKRLVSPETVHITMSFGVADKLKEDLGPDDVMKRADKKLYVAKKAGRNCVKH